MKFAPVVGVLLMAALVTAAAAAPPQPAPCSPARSPVRMTGPPIGIGSSVICGSRFADRIYARGHTVFAFAGNDVVYARNRRADDIRGGPGLDRAYVDRIDRVHGVERVIRR